MAKKKKKSPNSKKNSASKDSQKKKAPVLKTAASESDPEKVSAKAENTSKKNSKKNTSGKSKNSPAENPAKKDSIKTQKAPIPFSSVPSSNTKNPDPTQDRSEINESFSEKNRTIPADGNKSSVSDEKEKKGKKIFFTVLKIFSIIVVCGGIVAGCLFGNHYYKIAVHYGDHFYPGTYINGTDCSEMTAEEAKQTIQDRLNGYTFTFTDHEGRSSTITAPEIDVLYADNGEVGQILFDQDNERWMFREKETESFTVTSGYTYNHEKLSAWIAALPCLNDGVSSTDAFEYQGEDGFWYIEPETYGDAIYPSVVESVITNAVDNAASAADLDGTDCFIPPDITAQDEALTASVKEKNDAILRAIKRAERIDEITDVELIFNSYIDRAYLNEELLRGMIVDDENGDPVIDKKQVKAWVKNWAKERGLDQQANLFVTHGGRLMNVSNGPLSGWKLDVDATAKKAYQAILDRKSGILHPVTTDRNGNLQTDMTYVEINIMKQKMWFYLEGELLVETPVVTGDILKGYDTPSNGVWYIYYKTYDYTMRGPRLSNGQYEYVTHVSYWMPFNDQIGIHDMVTRPAFGGEIYKGNGSHGCVNTPIENVKVIYENASIGTPVVVHS